MVTYNRTTWVDGSSGGTPINSTRLNNIETGLVAFAVDSDVKEAAIAAKAAANTVYTRTQIDSMLAALGATGGGVLTLLQQSNGYCAPGSTTPVTSPATGYSYIFKGLATPPFQREQDLWVKIDRGIIATPVVLQLRSSDDFAQGQNATPAAAAALDTTRWGGDVTFFRQSSTGTFDPTGWGTTARDYLVLDKYQAAQPQMRVEFQSIGYASTSTQRTLRLVVNATAPTMDGTNFTGYSVIMDTTSSGTSENWSVARKENGATTSTLGTFTQTKSGNPRNIIVASDGVGGITVTVDGVVLNNGAKFVDPGTPLTGRYAGVGGYCQTNSAAASMNAKGDNWRLYA